jgi:NAD(P)-dependent dehydrogenase (short-subunit alcohol dehydrogenase family)
MSPAQGRLAHQSVLVIGGGSGIGRAAATALHREGATVTVLERSAASTQDLVDDLGPDRLHGVTGDGTEPSDLVRAVAAATAAGGRLDNLTCCVGVFDHYADIFDLTPEELVHAAQEIWRINVLGTLQAVHAAVAPLRSSRGSITLTLSESAFHPVGGGVLYGSSKWALRGVVQQLSARLAPDIRVNAVAPGGTTGTRFGGLTSLGLADRTVEHSEGRDERIAAGSLLRTAPGPEDHAGCYTFLADRTAAATLTGQIINSDGGRVLT